jgi:hypothetical protein
VYYQPSSAICLIGASLIAIAILWLPRRGSRAWTRGFGHWANVPLAPVLGLALGIFRHSAVGGTLASNDHVLSLVANCVACTMVCLLILKTICWLRGGRKGGDPLPSPDRRDHCS